MQMQGYQVHFQEYCDINDDFNEMLNYQLSEIEATTIGHYHWRLFRTKFSTPMISNGKKDPRVRKTLHHWQGLTISLRMIA